MDEIEETYQCEICNVKFTSYVEQYQCHICSKLYKNDSRHFRTAHLGERPLDCKVCGKTASSKLDHQNHMRTHTGERPFQCEKCDKAFSQKSNLRAHVKTTHRKEKEFRCPICFLEYTRKRLLAYHVYAKHTNVKPISCNYCDKGYIYPAELKKHMRRCKSNAQKHPEMFEVIFKGEDGHWYGCLDVKEPNYASISLENALKCALENIYIDNVTEENNDILIIGDDFSQSQIYE